MQKQILSSTHPHHKAHTHLSRARQAFKTRKVQVGMRAVRQACLTVKGIQVPTLDDLQDDKKELGTWEKVIQWYQESINAVFETEMA